MLSQCQRFVRSACYACLVRFGMASGDVHGEIPQLPFRIGGFDSRRLHQSDNEQKEQSRLDCSFWESEIAISKDIVAEI